MQVQSAVRALPEGVVCSVPGTLKNSFHRGLAYSAVGHEPDQRSAQTARLRVCSDPRAYLFAVEDRSEIVLVGPSGVAGLVGAVGVGPVRFR